MEKAPLAPLSGGARLRKVSFDHSLAKNKNSIPEDAPSKSESETQSVEQNCPQMLQHGSYEMVGIEKGGRQFDVRPCRVGKIISPTQRMLVPLYQRRYCWDGALYRTWWRDLCGTSPVGEHRIGKILITAMDEQLNAISGKTEEWYLCIDGQQRYTTSSICVAALRDRLLQLMRGTSSKSAGEICLQAYRHIAIPVQRHASSQEPETAPSFDAEVPVLASAMCVEEMHDDDNDEGKDNDDSSKQSSVHLELLQRLNAFLYADEALFVTLLEDLVTAQQTATTVEEWLRKKKDHLSAVSRLVPSWLDRPSYFCVLWEGLFLNSTTTSAEMGCPSQDSLQWSCKKAFDQYAAEAALPMLLHLTDTLMKAFSVMRMELVARGNVQQLFLWMQEKSLWGMGALLFNPTPGRDFESQDLVRNLLVSCFMQKEVRVQEQILESCWLQPIENVVAAHQISWSDLIQTFLQRLKPAICPKCSLESTVEQVAQSGVFRLRKDSSIVIYAHFLSYWEWLVASEPTTDEAALQQRLEHLATELMAQMAEHLQLYLQRLPST
jgi:hypothetical protein